MLRQAAARAASGLRAAGQAAPRQQMRGYAGHGHGHGGVEHGGLTLYPASSWHQTVGTGMSALMWFWVLLRWKEDGATLIFGHAPHFEHEIAHEEAHAAESVRYKPGAKH